MPYFGMYGGENSSFLLADSRLFLRPAVILNLAYLKENKSDELSMKKNYRTHISRNHF